MSNPNQKRVKPDDEDYSSSDEEPIHSFIPGDGVEVDALAAYLQDYIDDTATIRPTKSPFDKDMVGFTISAKYTLSSAGLRDIINDSNDWLTEKKSRKWREERYRYLDSQTWKRRTRHGPARGIRVRPRKHDREAAAQSATIPGRGTTPSSMPGIRFKEADREELSPPQRRGSDAYYAAPGRPDAAPSSFNIQYANMSYTSAPSTAAYARGSYGISGGVGRASPQEYESGSPPPSFEGKQPPLPGMPPTQPDPDGYDRARQNIAARRQPKYDDGRSRNFE